MCSEREISLLRIEAGPVGSADEPIGLKGRFILVFDLKGNGIDFLALPPDVALFEASLALLEAAPAIDMPFLREAGQLSSPGVLFDLLSPSRRTSACLVESSVATGAPEPLLRPLMDIEP